MTYGVLMAVISDLVASKPVVKAMPRTALLGGVLHISVRHACREDFAIVLRTASLCVMDKEREARWDEALSWRGCP
jgi:hypothetical protein